MNTSVNLRTENIQTTISQLISDFAGRKDTNDYDSSKLIHIHRRNRPFVWSIAMQQKLLDSLLKGYYVPPIICSSEVINGTEHRFVMEGGNRITTFKKILTNQIRELTIDELRKIESYPITIVVMRNLNVQQQREMFRRLNKNIKVTDGQLYAMSEDDSPLVKEAIALLNEDKYPLREIITTHFGDMKEKDTNSRGLLANAVALVSGAIHGPKYITKSYNTQEPKIECQQPINRQMLIAILSNVFEVFSMADQIVPVVANRFVKQGNFNVGKYIGCIIYDLHINPGKTQNVLKKWVTYLVKVRNNEPYANEAINISGAQNLTCDKLKRISEKVHIYITQNRIALKDELTTYRHIDEHKSPIDYYTEDEDEEDDEDNDSVSSSSCDK